jgi:hypothetical protein
MNMFGFCCEGKYISWLCVIHLCIRIEISVLMMESEVSPEISYNHDTMAYIQKFLLN